MSLISLLILVIVAALVWWLLSVYILPHVAQPFRTIIIVILVLIAIVWLLNSIGVVSGLRIK